MKLDIQLLLHPAGGKRAPGNAEVEAGGTHWPRSTARKAARKKGREGQKGWGLSQNGMVRGTFLDSRENPGTSRVADPATLSISSAPDGLTAASPSPDNAGEATARLPRALLEATVFLPRRCLFLAAL